VIFSRRFETLGRRQYPKDHMAEAKHFKDTEKIPHIERNECANTFLESVCTLLSLEMNYENPLLNDNHSLQQRLLNVASLLTWKTLLEI
jgi:hypothetical protein